MSFERAQHTAKNHVHPCAIPHDAPIYVAGHMGLVGSSVMRALLTAGYSNIITRSFQELDLRNQTHVRDFFDAMRPEYVIIAAAKVGGILANSRYPAEFMYDNLMITSNIIHTAYTHGVKKLIFLGSSCIYPRECTQPMREEYLLSGYLEKTNEAYAVAKIAGVMMCKSYNTQYSTNYVTGMPTNLYGPGDTFDSNNSHVIPALIQKIVQARKEKSSTVTLWGTGTALREFLYVDDLADAILFLLNNDISYNMVNIGTGTDISIADCAQLIAEIVGYSGKFIYDNTKPDGTPRKLLDVSRMTHLGWQARTSLIDGLKKTITWYYETQRK